MTNITKEMERFVFELFRKITKEVTKNEKNRCTPPYLTSTIYEKNK